MARFYKGVGVGTHLYSKDLRITGITPRNLGGRHSVDEIMVHIANGTANSPYVSLTRSFGVAKDYAMNASRTRPTKAQPAYVYVVDIDKRDKVEGFDPVFTIAKDFANPFDSPSYQHDGGQTFLLGVVEPVAMAAYLTAPRPQPTAASGAAVRPPRLTGELEAIVRALRDAEVMVRGHVPQSCIPSRFEEF